VDGRMIDRDLAFGHHFLEIAQAQRVGHVPAHARQDHIKWVMQAFKHAGHGRIQRLHQAFSRSSCPPHHSPPSYCNRTIKKDALIRWIGTHHLYQLDNALSSGHGRMRIAA
jgi:hypothetical protein